MPAKSPRAPVAEIAPSTVVVPETVSRMAPPPQPSFVMVPPALPWPPPLPMVVGFRTEP